MKRVALIAVLLAFVPSAHAAACSPLDCSPSQFVLGGGTMLGVRGAPDRPLRVIDLRTGVTRWRLPAGIVTGNTLVSQSGGLLTWYDTKTGARVRALLADGRLVGTSQDATRAVLQRGSTFTIVAPHLHRLVKLGRGNWQFDALNGQNLFLIQQLDNGYKVRLFDLATNALQQQPLKDQEKSALIQGIPFQRASSPNGRYLFTLYIDGNGNAMIHQLDTAAGHAYCIDLPGVGDFGSAMTWAIVPTNATLWAVSVGYGRIAAVDVAAHVVRERASFYSIPWTANPGIAAMARDGKRLVVADAQHTWFVSLATLKVRRGPSHVAIAIAFAPDGSRVWGVGERSKVFALRVHR